MDTNYFRLVTEDLKGNQDEAFKGTEDGCLAKADELFDQGYADEFILQQLVLDDGLRGDYWLDVGYLYPGDEFVE